MRQLFYLNKYFVKYKWRLMGGILFVVLQNLLAIYPAQLVRKALDAVVLALKDFQVQGATDKATFAASVNHTIFIFLLIIIGVSLLRGVLMFMMRQTLIVMSRWIEYDLKNEIYEHYQKLSLAFYRRNNTGDLLNRISEDVTRVRMYLGPALMYSINLFVLIVFIVFIMFTVDVKLTLYVLLPMPLLALSIYWVSDIMNRKGEEVQERQSGLSTFVQEAFSGIRVLKAFVKEMESEKEFEKQSEEYRLKSMELTRVNALFFPLMLLLVGISTLMVIYIGGKEVIAGRITAGNIAEFIIYVNMLTWPVALLGWVTSIVQRAAASQKRINEFLHTQPEIISPATAPGALKGKIEFRNVSFVYPDSGIQALNTVSFKVEEGESLAILGRTGSGKSTIANLILRMYDATGGEILIDNKRVQNYSLESMREQIGYVPQDVFLFSDSIRNNIAFGIKEDKAGKEQLEERIKSAAQDAVIYDNIIELPNGLDTVIGERGITLSGGQKQRVSIARALIKNPKVLLFDDCLSAVDTHTEEQILQNLERHMQNRTSIIISHRVSSVKNAAQIIVLDNGKIVERGTHDSLLLHRGIYFGLYEKQLLEEETA
jgi:ATP-binding cassette, subfamily B, multidrug efflux pump